MTRELKVYGWLTFRRVNEQLQQVQAIVAAPSFAAVCRAAEAAGEPKPHKDYTSTTGNPTEVAVAMSDPGTLFVARDDRMVDREFDPA